MRKPSAQAIAFAAEPAPTCTCSPKTGCRDASQPSLSASSVYRGRSVTSCSSQRENGCVPAAASAAPWSAAIRLSRSRRSTTSSTASSTVTAIRVEISSTDCSSSGSTRSRMDSSATVARIGSIRGTSSNDSGSTSWNSSSMPRLYGVLVPKFVSMRSFYP